MAQLVVGGAVDRPRTFSEADLLAMPGQVEDVGALVPGRSGGGVRLSSLLSAVGARGAFITLVAADGFSISVPRAPVEDGVVAFRLGGGALPDDKGGPLRFFVVGAVECKTGEVDACANVKRLVELRVTAEKAEDTHRH